MSVREAPQLPDEPGTDCAQLRYSECSAPCKWVGWTRFTGYCELAPEGAAAEGSVEGAAAQDVAEGGGEAANLEPAF